MKTQKYIYYVIGEIVLVVVGILIAVQINNWNENRKLTNKEQQILRDLHSEFSLNYQSLQSQSSKYAIMVMHHKDYIEKMLNGTLSFDDIIKFHDGRMLTAGTLNPTFGVVNSLLDSGEIVLVSNHELRYMLSNWKYQLSDYVENEVLHLEVFFLSNFDPFIKTHFLTMNSDQMPLNYSDQEREQIFQDYMDTVKTTQYRNFVINNMEWLNMLQSEAEETIVLINNIRKNLDNELGLHQESE